MTLTPEHLTTHQIQSLANLNAVLARYDHAYIEELLAALQTGLDEYRAAKHAAGNHQMCLLGCMDKMPRQTVNGNPIGTRVISGAEVDGDDALDNRSERKRLAQDMLDAGRQAQFEAARRAAMETREARVAVVVKEMQHAPLS